MDHLGHLLPSLAPRQAQVAQWLVVCRRCFSLGGLLCRFVVSDFHYHSSFISLPLPPGCHPKPILLPATPGLVVGCVRQLLTEMLLRPVGGPHRYLAGPLRLLCIPAVPPDGLLTLAVVVDLADGTPLWTHHKLKL